VKSIALCRFMLDAGYVAGCRYSLAEARLAARLRQHGIDARLYAGKSEGRVVDIARQLVRMRTDACLLAVAPQTMALARHVVEQILAIVPGLTVLLQAAEEARPAEAVATALSQAWISDDPDAAFTQLLQAMGCTAKDQLDADGSSPYLSGLLHREDVERLGLSADQALSTFKNELAWLSRCQPPIARTTVHALGCSAQQVRAVAQALIEAAADTAWSILTDAPWPAAETSELKLPRRIELVSSVPEAASPRVYGANGVIALHTGLYPDATLTAGVRHLELDADLSSPQRQAAYAWAAPHLMTRSALVMHSSASRPAPDLAALQTPAVAETNGWPSHSYLFESTEPQEIRVTLDGREENTLAVTEVPMRALAGTRLDATKINIITLREAEDVQAFERRLEQLTNAGKLCIEQACVARHFENSCRWTRRGTCQLPLLRRVQVQQDAKLSSCRDAGEMGSIRSGYDEIVMQLKRGQQVKAIERECAVCHVRDECSQCTQLPASWGGRYCAIRKAHTCTSLYMELVSLSQMLASLFGLAPADDLDLRVSFAGLPNQHFNGQVPGQPRAGERPVILSALGKHIAWRRGTRKLCRLSAPLALMAEAWWSDGSEDAVVEQLCDRFKVLPQLAKDSLKAGNEKLRTEGMIHA
jgi:hypothetical protein